jgi:hypothetical protein
MAQERYIAVYPPALKLPAGGNPATHALEQGMAAWSQQLQQWLSQEVSKILGQATDHGQQIDALSQEVSKILGQATDHGQQIDALENVGKIKARAYRYAAQDIDAGPDVTTKVLIDTISFDTESVIDIANSRIIPNLPGYYIVTANIRVRAVPDGMRVAAVVFKNGYFALYGTNVNQGADGLSSSIASDIVYMNGTSDYLELYANKTYSPALALYTGYPYYNYLSILGPF